MMFRLSACFTMIRFHLGCTDLSTQNSMLMSIGCLGCCVEPPLIIAVDKPSKGLRIQDRAVKKGSIAEEFWSSSTYEMEISAIQSQRSISSISTSYQ